MTRTAGEQDNYNPTLVCTAIPEKKGESYHFKVALFLLFDCNIIQKIFSPWQIDLKYKLIKWHASPLFWEMANIFFSFFSDLNVGLKQS